LRREARGIHYDKAVAVRASAIPKITYFAMLPFSRIEEGDFVAEAAIEVRSAEQARGMAARMEDPERGAVAFSKTSDPQLGARQGAVIPGRYGDMPDDLAHLGLGQRTRPVTLMRRRGASGP
jgi:hypothetical protein